VNSQEKKLQFYLLYYQGIYYGVGSFLLLLFNGAGNLDNQFFVYPKINLLADGLLIGIGLSLYVGKHTRKNSLPIILLGIFSAFTLLLSQVNRAFSQSSNLLQSLDLLIEVVFLAAWSYLIYWQWIEGEFTEMNRKKRDSSK
tara:strand:+ start:91 stop:516 length:426 start_codon:yes stop_codon:yes gene_type:complete